MTGGPDEATDVRAPDERSSEGQGRASSTTPRGPTRWGPLWWPPPWRRLLWQVPLAAALIASAANTMTALSASSFSFLCGMLPAVYLAAVTGELARVDIAEHRLPNRLVLPGLAVAVGCLVMLWIVSGRVPVTSLVAGAGMLLFFVAANLAGSMGMGDVKLAALIGFVLGLLGDVTASDASAALGFTPVLCGGILAFLTGGGAALVALARHPRRTRARIAFGPFLLVGFWGAFATASLFG